MKAIGDMREVVKNEKTNLLQLEEHFYQLNDVAEPNVFRNLFPYDEDARRLHLMTVSCRIICRKKSGSRIPHSGMDSSPELRIRQSRS